MNIAKKKMKIQSLLVNPIIDLESPLEKVLKQGEYIAIKCYDTPNDKDTESYRSTSPTIEDNHLRNGLSRKTNYSRS